MSRRVRNFSGNSRILRRVVIVISRVVWRANIPAAVKSVEFISVSNVVDGRRAYAYRQFEGDPL